MQNNRFMNTAAATSSQIDVGLRAYMLGVYNHMTTALLLTGFFAYATKMLATTTGPDGKIYLTSLGSALFNTPLQWVVMLAPLGMVFGCQHVYKPCLQVKRVTCFTYMAR